MKPVPPVIKTFTIYRPSFLRPLWQCDAAGSLESWRLRLRGCAVACCCKKVPRTPMRRLVGGQRFLEIRRNLRNPRLGIERQLDFDLVARFYPRRLPVLSAEGKHVDVAIGSDRAPVGVLSDPDRDRRLLSFAERFDDFDRDWESRSGLSAQFDDGSEPLSFLHNRPPAKS